MLNRKCLKKRRYATRAAAQRAADKLAQRVLLCLDCENFHTTAEPLRVEMSSVAGRRRVAARQAAEIVADWRRRLFEIGDEIDRARRAELGQR
jgi:hypothetical protein